ncbi:hypothetical protein D3C83_322990 [compost metagenome]
MPPEYSWPNAESRVLTLKRRTSTLMPVSFFCTVPMMTPSAFSSSQRSNGTSAIEVAAGIEL